MPFRFFSISMYGKARLLNRYLNLVFFDIHDAAFIIAAARCTRAIIKGKKIGTKACLFVVISIAGNCSKIFLKKSFRPLPIIYIHCNVFNFHRDFLSDLKGSENLWHCSGAD